ncbi:MAG: hypothetical protein BWY52_00335 [Chloroflexi bacterium ADurb.Bin325]|nr:MAG: hypothetical protein BWY52_00335 [Chloroflexi bacterium ADurb.Bin325]
MPRGDRTGPLGAGPMTGRGAGWCAGYDRPGYAQAAPGFGRGGYRAGGRGWRNMFYATGLPFWARGGVPPAVQPTPDQEVMELRTQANWLAQQLEAIQRRIEALGGESSQP